MEFKDYLFEKQDILYADFEAKLTPTIPRNKFIGVRVPECRKLAKTLYKTKGKSDFLKELPHTYFDENMLHGLLLSEEKDFHVCIKGVEEFLPFVDNWAVCDIMSPKVFKKHKEELLEYIDKWSKSSHEYTCRFAIEMLMTHFLDEDFKKEYLQIPTSVKSELYYINMMLAWFFATALAKQWDDTIIVFEKNSLDVWVHNKTIQKAIESYRITNEQKEYLRTLKRKV